MIRRLALVLMFASAAGFASTARPVSTTHLDIFETFRLLDEQFSKLDGHYRELQQALAAPHKQGRKTWRREVRAMQKSTAQICRLSLPMYSRYGRPSSGLRRRMFAHLDERARMVNKRLSALQRESSRAAVQKSSRKLKIAMLDLVLQYQAISGGYAATNCDPGTWTCGVAKKEPRRVGYPQMGVKWTCAPRRDACQGILGPRSPMLSPEPLTAGAVVH